MTRRSRAQAAIATELDQRLAPADTCWATPEETRDTALRAARRAVDALLADGWHITAHPHLPAPHTPQETHRAHRHT